jgi:hypothetical protein
MSVNGSWQFIVESPMGTQTAKVNLVADGDQVSGTLLNTGNGLSSDIFDGSIKGDQLAFKIKLNKLRLTLSFDTVVLQDEISGKVKIGAFGKFDVVGTRLSAA